MNLLVIVLCYSGDQAQVEHQLDSYTHHGAPVLALSPEDAPAVIRHPQVTNIHSGLSGWKGRHVSAKFLAHWKIMLEQPYDWFLAHEPDTVCLEAQLPDYLLESQDVLWCINPQPTGGIHSPPWFCHRRVLEHLVADAEEHLPEWDDSWDASEGEAGEGMGNSEMMSTAIDSAGIEWRHLPESMWVYKENGLGYLVDAAAQGKFWLHGLKTPGGYLAVSRAYMSYKAAARL